VSTLGVAWRCNGVRMGGEVLGNHMLYWTLWKAEGSFAVWLPTQETLVHSLGPGGRSHRSQMRLLEHSLSKVRRRAAAHGTSAVILLITFFFS